ncbi:hypothetical protein [Prevotella sp. P6B1]|uniref:hypothetical protein n=1 Tax=Prevotella sp. P6B1 TaxID=1410613 RepID=UPI00051BD123|nr:hypothetical protein [Prevotella sp. P6B1]
MQKFFKKQLLQQNVKMDSNVNFMVNGDINIQPCPWEQDVDLTDGRPVYYCANLEVMADGQTRVKAKRTGSRGPLYQTLFETSHGVVKIVPQRKHRRPEREKVIVEFKFPRRYGLELTKKLYAEEADQVMSYFKTRKEECLWNQH